MSKTMYQREGIDVAAACVPMVEAIARIDIARHRIAGRDVPPLASRPQRPDARYPEPWRDASLRMVVGDKNYFACWANHVIDVKATANQVSAAYADGHRTPADLVRDTAAARASGDEAERMDREDATACLRAIEAAHASMIDDLRHVAALAGSARTTIG